MMTNLQRRFENGKRGEGGREGETRRGNQLTSKVFPVPENLLITTDRQRLQTARDIKGLWEHFSRSWHHKVCSKFQRSFSTTSLSLDGPVQERVHHPHRNFHWSLLEFLQGCSWRWRMALWWQVK